MSAAEEGEQDSSIKEVTGEKKYGYKIQSFILKLILYKLDFALNK